MGERDPYWLAFSFVPGVGLVRITRLLDAFGELSKAWHAHPDALRRAGMGPKTVVAILKVRESLDLDRILSTLKRLGVHFLTYNSPEYPESLAHIEGPPATLFVKGSLMSIDRHAVAVVGTRRPSPYGIGQTKKIVASLVGNGITIVSGLARGIDGIAHRAALEAGGKTIAVLGSGIDRIYPAEHRTLAEQISRNGAVISEYPPGRGAEGHHFPARNRIISGISRGVIVVEAAERSGALITAGFGADQGKEVFALPGDVTRKTSVGTNRLIQDGAHPILTMDDMLDVLEIRGATEQAHIASYNPEDAIQREIMAALHEDVVDIDGLYLKTGLPIHDLQAGLAMLELSGVIEKHGGQYILRVRESSEEYFVD